MKPIKKSPSIPNASQEIDPLRQNFRGQAEEAQLHQQLLRQQLDKIRVRQAHWLNRLTITEGERRMLETFWKKQGEALQSVLEGRNAGLRVIGDAQLEFIKEVCDSLLISTRSQVQLKRSTAFQQRFLELNNQLEYLNETFFSLVAKKIETMEGLSGRLHGIYLGQVERMLEKWDQTYEMALSEFAGIIQRRREEDGSKLGEPLF